MATKSKSLFGFSRMKDDELVVLTTTVINAMTDNTNFATPSPALADVQLLLDEFLGKLAIVRKKGSPEDTAVKDEQKEILAEALQKLSYYVNSVANGRLSTVLSSGFPTAAPSTGSLVPLKVSDVRASDGRQSGQVKLDFEKQKIVRVYEYCYRNITEPDAEWSDRLTTTSSRNNIIAPLEVGQWYEIRVRAVNTKGAGDWSDIAKILVR